MGIDYKFITCLADIPNNVHYSIYGSGNSGQNLYHLINQYRKDLVLDYFIDSFKEDLDCTIPVILAKNFFKQINTPLILIASEFWYEIEKTLIEHNFHNYLKVPIRFLYDKTIPEINAKASQVKPENNCFFPLFFNGQESAEVVNKLKAVEDLLHDDEDKKLYQIITCQNVSSKQCMTNIIDYYFSHKPKSQYFDHIDKSVIKTIIEGGVYNAKESLQFIDAFSKDLIIHGFEPFEEILFNSPYYKQIKHTNFQHVNKGLWGTNNSFYFDLNGSSSHLKKEKTKDSDIRIDVTSIDNYVEQADIERIDFIKLDIEGAELDALKGGVKTIKRDRPQLAICIYHKQSDFYDIPLYLNEVLSDYVFRLNHYTASPYETVWYAIPQELYQESMTD